MSFGTSNRLYNSWYSTTNVPSVECTNERNSFSVSSSVAHLDYPVGLLTADEIVMAGVAGISNTANNTYYLYTGGNYWTMSPSSWSFHNMGSFAWVWCVKDTGSIGSCQTNMPSYVRPVVSLKPGIEFESDGDGTSTNPYVVKYNN